MSEALVPILLLSQIIISYFIFNLKMDNKKLFLAIKKMDELQQPLWDFVEKVARECKDLHLVKQAKLLLKKRFLLPQR